MRSFRSITLLRKLCNHPDLMKNHVLQHTGPKVNHRAPPPPTGLQALGSKKSREKKATKSREKKATSRSSHVVHTVIAVEGEEGELLEADVSDGDAVDSTE